MIHHSHTMSYGRIKYRILRGESTHRIALFMQRSICGAANIPLLNWSEKGGDSPSMHIRGISGSMDGPCHLRQAIRGSTAGPEQHGRGNLEPGWRIAPKSLNAEAIDNYSNFFEDY